MRGMQRLWLKKPKYFERPVVNLIYNDTERGHFLGVRSEK